MINNYTRLALPFSCSRFRFRLVITALKLVLTLNPYEMSIIPKGTWIVVTGGPHCGWRGCVEGVLGTGPDLAYCILFKHVDQDWVTLAIPARWVVG